MKPTVVHDTVVFERVLAAAPSRVFEAWSRADLRAKWDIPKEGWSAEYEQDFRVGGVQRGTFGPKGGPLHHSVGHYVDIVENVRIVSMGTMMEETTRTAATLCTVELLANGRGTRLVLTDQSAFFNGREAPSDRQSGWGSILDHLARYLDNEKGAAS